MKKNIVIIVSILFISSLFALGYYFVQSNSQVSADSWTDTIGTVNSTNSSSTTNTNSSSNTTSSSSNGIQLPTKPDNLPQVDITATINKIIQIIFAVGEIAFAILLLIGGVMYITSAGEEDQTNKAKKLMLNAIIGIVILFSAWGIANWIIGFLS